MKGCIRSVFCKVEVEYEINCINFKSDGRGGGGWGVYDSFDKTYRVSRKNYLYILGNEGGTRWLFHVGRQLFAFLCYPYTVWR